MGTYDELSPGMTWTTPQRVITEEEVRQVIELTGFVHPLFTDPEHARRSAFGATPLPGQAVLAIAGGLMEQSDRIDSTVIGLIGMQDVRFRAPVLPGATVSVEVTVADKTRTSSGDRGVVDLDVACLTDGEVAATWRASFLFQLD